MLADGIMVSNALPHNELQDKAQLNHLLLQYRSWPAQGIHLS